MRPIPAYNPWHHLQAHWPRAEVSIEPLPGDLLGLTRFPPLHIALSSYSSPAQRRCTLAHEIVHLERDPIRGDDADQPLGWSPREERRVHAVAATRLIHADALVAAIRDLGGNDDRAALSALLDVDTETLQVRLALLDPHERAAIWQQVGTELWAVA